MINRLVRRVPKKPGPQTAATGRTRHQRREAAYKSFLPPPPPHGNKESVLKIREVKNRAEP